MFRSTFVVAAIAIVALAQDTNPPPPPPGPGPDPHPKPPGPGPDPDNVSRAGRDLSFVIALNAPALSSPSTNLNLAVDPKQEAKMAHRITPVGQRQQFLIGSELRKRYVDEAKLLNPEYIISQLFLQAPFVAQNILSLQAQMMGIYPSTHANDLTPWQQKNAVPPIDGVDFSKWQKELGASALPHGLQTFPIQQTGFERDWMLSMSTKNCQVYSDAVSAQLTQISTDLDTTISTDFPQIYEKMTDANVSGVEVCDYLTWARSNAVPLQGDHSFQQDFDTMVYDTCPTELYAKTTQVVINANNDNNNLVVSGFLANIRDKVTIATDSQSDNGIDLPLAFTNYQAFTSDILLAVASQTLVDVDTTNTLPASSNLIFEVGADQSIRGWLNDEEYSVNCGEAADVCTADNFVAALNASIGYDDLEAACAGSSTDEKLDILQ